MAFGAGGRGRADIAGPTREEAIKSYFEPARRRGEIEAVIVSGVIHNTLGLSGRHAAVCNALQDKTGKLQQRARAELIRIEEPNPSSTTRFIYRLL